MKSRFALICLLILVPPIAAASNVVAVKAIHELAL
jgi:hypothetical protein